MRLSSSVLLVVILLSLIPTPLAKATKASSNTLGATHKQPTNKQHTLHLLGLDHLPAGVRYGLLVSDIASGEVLLSHEADTPFIPASTMKLITAAAVLGSRGENGWWSTELSLRTPTSAQKDPTQQDPTQKNSAQELLLMGSNDPTLSLRQGNNSLRELAKLAHQQGVRQVTQVNIGEWRGESSVTLSNWRYPLPKTPQELRNRLGAAFIAELEQAGITVEQKEIGAVALDRSPSTVPINSTQPSQTSQAQATPLQPLADWTAIASVRSESVVPLLLSTLRPSNNEQAESLLRTLANERVSASEHTKELLTQMGLPLKGVVLADGSGLSRDNRLTPRALNYLLKHMYDLPFSEKTALPAVLFDTRNNHFINALPRAGVAGKQGGTLSYRLRGTGLDVRAKTGTLPGVSALSGYLKTRNGRLLAFTLLMNGPDESPILSLRAAQDRAVKVLAELY